MQPGELRWLPTFQPHQANNKCLDEQRQHSGGESRPLLLPGSASFIITHLSSTAPSSLNVNTALFPPGHKMKRRLTPAPTHLRQHCPGSRLARRAFTAPARALSRRFHATTSQFSLLRNAEIAQQILQEPPPSAGIARPA